MQRTLVVLLLSCWAPFTWGEATMSFSFGQVGVYDGKMERPQWYGLEFHGGPATKFEIRPGGGIARAACGATYLHVNFRKAFWLSDRWGLLHYFGPGYFIESEHLRLGHALQFRSGLELVYRTPRDTQVAFGIAHLSNAGIGRLNPGTETLAFTVAFPL